MSAHQKTKARLSDRLRLVMLALLLGTSLLHFVVAESAGPELRPGLLVFTVLFMIAAVVLRTAPRVGAVVAMVVAGLGLVVGGGRYLSAGGPPTMLAMFAIDAALLALGWLSLRGARRG